MRFLLRLVLNAVAIIVAAYVVPGVRVAGPEAALVAGVILGLINTFIRPLLSFLAFPITVITLGLFTLVINAVCFALTAELVDGLELDGATAAVLGALFVSVVSWLLSLVLVPKNKE